MILHDEKIRSTVIVKISGYDGSGILELNFVEAHICGDIFEAVGAEIAKQADFAFAVFGFTNSNEINPAVVVVVEGGDAPGARPVSLWKCQLLNTFSSVVSPKAKVGSPPMSESNIHPAVVVNIEYGNASERRGCASSRKFGRGKLPLPRIPVYRC